MNKEEARRMYEDACDAYAQAFAERHGFDFSDAEWVASDKGGICLFGDYYVGFETIKYDVDNEPDKDEFIRYYDYCIEANEFGLTIPNYRSWCMGCPRTSPEAFEELRKFKKQLDDLIGYERNKNSGGKTQ